MRREHRSAPTHSACPATPSLDVAVPAGQGHSEEPLNSSPGNRHLRRCQDGNRGLHAGPQAEQLTQVPWSPNMNGSNPLAPPETNNQRSVTRDNLAERGGMQPLTHSGRGQTGCFVTHDCVAGGDHGAVGCVHAIRDRLMMDGSGRHGDRSVPRTPDLDCRGGRFGIEGDDFRGGVIMSST